MKTYNKLWSEFISDKNILLAIKNASKGKKDRKYVKMISNEPEKWVPYFRELVSNYKNEKHTPKEIYDGISRKKRTIIVPTFDEEVVHHMVVNMLKPIFQKSFYYHSYGSIPGKGSHKAKKFIEKWIKNDVKNTKYVLQMDVKKYFDNVPHDILLFKLSKIITDKKFMELLSEIIEVVPNGLPLGFYTSQWFANFYLSSLDHYIKHDLKVKYYVRYMDDMVVLGSNKRQLHKVEIKIQEYLKSIGLEMKSSHQVYKLKYDEKHGRFLDFMGFRFYRNRTTLRKKIYIRMCRKAKKIGKKEKPTVYDCRQMVSYIGWLNNTNTYSSYVQYIKPFVSFKNMKKRISKYEKRNKLCGNIQNQIQNQN